MMEKELRGIVAKKGWYPYSVNIELTLACNMRCEHCGSSAGRPRPDELSVREFDTLFADLKRLGGQEVCLLGGEPFVRQDWFDVAQAADAHGLGLVFISNGFAVDKKLVNKAMGLKGLDRVGISIDGANADIHDAIRRRQGSFDKAWNAVKLFRDAGVETGIITTVTKHNLADLPKMAQMLAGQDITWQIQMATPEGARFDRGFMLSPKEFYWVGAFISRIRNTIPVTRLPVAGSHDIGYNSRVLSRYSELPEWDGCAAGLYTLGILSDGRIKGCLSMHDDFIEDSIRNHGLVDIWNDPKLFARNRYFDVSQLSGPCKGCEFGAKCRAGCANVSYTVTGDTFNNPYCFYHLEKEGIADDIKVDLPKGL